ncbi:hypothetical protein OK016_00170 [Vibrio chagasii]|nr:hypothetical protein [Vibrio chagasii]
MVKDPTAATTTINDDSDVTTGEFVSGMRQSPKARTSPTRRHHANPADGAADG